MFVPSGLNGSLLMQGAQTRISAALKDVVVLDVDPQSVHKKVSEQDTGTSHFSHLRELFSCFAFISFFIHCPFSSYIGLLDFESTVFSVVYLRGLLYL